MKGYIDKKILSAYGILIAVACISLIFTNISYDAEYQMAMAYRMLKGDKMILQMWEPHQTSAFLCAIFMKFYMTLFGTTTGIVLYLVETPITRYGRRKSFQIHIAFKIATVIAVGFKIGNTTPK